MRTARVPKDGGPAFPKVYAPLDHAISDGMSLLDYFAAAALMGIWAYNGKKDALFPELAKGAYDQAEAMLAERERRAG